MKHFLHLFVTISSLFLLIGIISCNKNDKTSAKEANSNEDLFSEVILDYTRGETAPGDPIRIVFRESVVTAEEIGKVQDSKVIHIEPALPGTLKWESESVLMYVPNTTKYNTHFQVSIDLKGLLGKIPGKNIPGVDFQFGFHTYPLELTVLTEPMQINKKASGSGTEVEIRGKMLFNAVIDSAVVESLLIVKADDGSRADLTWEHGQGDHTFIIKNIERTDKLKSLILQVDAPKELGLVGEYEKRFLIPAEGDFKVLSVAKNPESDREIIISFSDLLDEKMDLNGLIGLRGIDQRAEFRVRNNNVHLIYRSVMEGEKTLYVSRSLKSRGGKKLGKDFESQVFFSTPKPAVKLLSKGVISADIDQVILPFEAINLNAVDVEIAKVYENNMLQFLQYADLQELYLPSEVSEIIWQGKIDLSSLGASVPYGKWKRYGLDLMQLIRLETGALYNVRIGFRKAYTNYPCENENEKAFREAGIERLPALKDDAYQTIWRSWYQYSNSQWSDREDPCKPMYYRSDRFVQQNILASNIGMIAKYDDQDKLYATVVDLRTGAPRTGVDLKVYSYQQQLIGQGSTDEDGFASLEVGSKAYFLVAHDGDEFGYLKLNGYQTLSMSEFDINGKRQVRGIDGMIYAERGVWRPGDTIFLQFVLRDPDSEIPSDHPVTMTLYDPSGKEYKKITTARHIGPLYDFTCSTDPNAMTGNWRVSIAVGPRTFVKILKIETVKPNRLKIIMDIPEKDLVLNQSQLEMEVQWLTGLPGSGLTVDVDANLRAVPTRFENYGGYHFDDVTRKFSPREITLFHDKMDENGYSKIPLNLNEKFRFPGKISALFKVRAYEPSGEYSSNSFSGRISPYQGYVGIQFPKTRWGSASIKTNQKYDIPIVTLDAEGKPNPNRKLTMGLYEAQWRWWWDDSGNDMAQYNSDQHLKAFRKMDLVSDASGKTSMELELEDYGAYLIRICDTESGHCTGQLFYTGSYGGGDETAREFASMLKFTSDKNQYEIGDEVKLSIPAGKNANVLVTIETDGQVLQKEWIRSKKEVLDYSFKATEAMFPNAYAHVVVIQGLDERNNDLPVRQYGVLNLNISDKNKRLRPEISMKEVIRPSKPYEVTVSEAQGKEMYYTLAVVDDGLLDLTRFKTPELYDHFFAKRAMLTKNWDNYAEVISGDPGLLDRIISVGGDDAVEIQPDAEKANRFVPVVEFIGPFHLKKGAKEKHELKMANYSGSVRVMVVAASDHAYGSAEKTVKVKDEVMALITAPRVLSPAETIELPVTVFVTNPSIKSVEVSLKNEQLLDLQSDRSQLLQFEKPGEKICYFNLKSKEVEGVGKLDIVAEGANNIARQHLEIAIENPNVYQRSAETMAIPAGQSRSFSIPMIGMEGTNFAELEMSRLPSLNIEERVGYLLRYPYGCIEQTTSTVFPQLYLDNLMELSQDRQSRIKLHLIEGIDRLRSFRVSNNGLSYWPDSRNANPWGSVYAAHFLVEARLQGYNTSAVLPGLLDYLKGETKNYRISANRSSNFDNAITTQAYRTLVLARAGKPQYGAMNYLFKSEKLPPLAKYYLSLAYSYAGKRDIGRQLLANYTLPEVYYYNYWHYGTYLRDYAVLLMALDEAGMKSGAADVLLKMVKEYNNKRYWNTQTLAWFLNAVSKHLGEEKDKSLKFSVVLKNGKETIETEKPVYLFKLDENDIKNTQFNVTNTGTSDLYVSYTVHGKPVMGDEGESVEKYLDFNLAYYDETGNPLDVSTLKIGTEFKAVVRIKRKGLSRYVNEVALSQIIPSGWEILNWRLEGEQRNNWSLDYQDIRDDRVYSFFDLRGKEIQIEIPLHASYAGNFYLPQTFVEAMYEDEIYARKAGKWVQVVR